MADRFQKQLDSEADANEFDWGNHNVDESPKIDENPVIENAAIKAEEEEIEEEPKTWKDLEDYEIDVFWADQYRPYSDILEINAILNYFETLLTTKKQDVASIADLNHLKIMQEHYRLFAAGKFTYEQEFENAHQIYTKLNKTITKFCHAFDTQMVQTKLIQLMFPLDLIDNYLGIVNRTYGQPVYDKTLRLQTSLIEIFLWHHIKADTRFNLSMSTTNLNLIDPFLRIKIRESNRKDEKLNQKYFNSKFNLKKFILKILDLYFPNVTWRYIGGGQQMHRWSLQLVLVMFELGLWNYDELHELVNILFQKLENLLILEAKSYKDFETSLKDKPSFTSKLKQYFYECKEMATGICLHTILLINDNSFMQSHSHFNSSFKSDVVNSEEVWETAYFNNTDISKILHRILTQYILRASEDKGTQFSKKTIQYASDFLMMVTDQDSDMFYVSSKTVNKSMLKFYLEHTSKHQAKSALKYKEMFIGHLDLLATCFENKNMKNLEVKLIADLKDLLVLLATHQNEEQKRIFQYELALASLPNILLAIIGMLTELKASKECKITTVLAFVEVTKGSVIGQVLFLDNAGVDHVKTLFEEEPLLAMMIIEEVFKDDFHIFYVHRTIYNNFIEYFQANARTFLSNIQDYDNEVRTEEGLKQYQDHNKWFEEFQSEVTGERSSQLEELLTYCLYVRWLINLLHNQDTDFEEKFEEFVLQRALQRPFYDFFLRILMDKDFLPLRADGLYDFRPQLRQISTQGINELVQKKEEGSISNIELRGIVFEAAVMSLELLNRCCDRFYTNYIYSKKVAPIIENLLDSTEYLLKIEGGLEYRGLVLQMYTQMKIFPNNHLLSNREVVFQGPKLKSEVWIPKNHLGIEISESIMKQLKLMATISEFRHVQRNLDQQAKKYFFEGLFPMVLKYAKGMLYLYSNDASLAVVAEAFATIDIGLREAATFLRGDFSMELPSTINIDDIEVSPPGLGFGKMFDEGDTLFTPKTQKIHHDKPGKIGLVGQSGKRNKRQPDNEERYYPKLYELREKIMSIIGRVSSLYTHIDDKAVLAAFNKLEIALTRPNALTDNAHFDQHDSVMSNISSVHRSSNQSTKDLATLLVVRTGLDEKNMRYFKELMSAYLENKKKQLSKGKESNIFIKFLEGGSGSVDNIVGFFVLIINKIYSDLLVEKTPTSKPPKDAEDLPLMRFLETDLLFSFMSFLDKVSNECTKIKEALLSRIKDTDEGKNFLSIVYRLTLDLGLICQYKVFMDYDWKMMMTRFKVMTSFLKNLSENNFTGFKQLLGEFKPKIPQLEAFNRTDNDLFYDLYVRHEANASQYKLTNSHHRLIMNDRAEVYSVMDSYFQILSECVCGPFQANQNRIYHFRTDFWMSALNRIVDNMNSNSYDFKETVIDYILCLTEENEESTRHFSNNTTFTKIFDLIILLLKRLYIMTTITRKKKRHTRLVKEAERSVMDKEAKKKIEQENYEKYLQSQFGFYSQKAVTKELSNLNLNAENNEGKEDEDTHVHFEPLNPNYINQEMQDCVKVTNYQDIKDTYLESDDFSSGKILKLAMKLNDLLLKFAKISPSYSINLDNIYCALIDRYGDEVPLHIRKNFHFYERKSNYEFNEKLVFYMFLTKITAEITIRNPETGNDLTILYPLMPCTFFMTEQTKSDFMMSVDHSQIITGLIDRFEVFQVEMEENLAFYRRWPKFYSLSSDDSFTKIKSVVWSLGFLLNVLLVIFYSRELDRSVIDPTGYTAIVVVGAIISFLSFMFLIVWMMARYKQKVMNAKIENEFPKDAHPQGYTMLSYRIRIYLYYSFLKESYPIFFVIHILSTILGLTVNPFFLTLQLLTIVFISDTTLYVVQAITTHFDQLILTFILTIFVMYCYAVLTSEMFFDTLSSNGQSPVDCTHLWDCFLYHINFGIRSGGGIADVTNSVSPIDQPGYYVSKFFFDLMFFILINIISLNIIFGIIIDTFADMRDESSARSNLFSPRQSLGISMPYVLRR